VSEATSRPHISRIVLVFLIIVAFVVAAIVVVSVSQSPVVASQLNYNVHMNVNGIDVNGWTVDKCPTTTANGTGPWVCSIITNGVIQNNSLRFLTGQVVQVNLWFEYLKKQWQVPHEPKLWINWVHANRKLKEESVYWISTASREGRPHAAPIWGVWKRNSFFLKPTRGP